MSWLSKGVKDVVSHPLEAVVSPVTAGIHELSGLDWKQQMAIGGAVGTGAWLMAPGAAGAAGTTASGPAAGAASAGGVMRAMGGMSGVGNILGGAASIYGAIENANASRDANRTNVALAHEQMDFSANQAQREMDFQERMSSTSYQRAVDDMRKAGINPLMAVTNGGASSPSGAMGSGAAASVNPVPSVVANSMTSALDLIRTYASTKAALAGARAADASVPKQQADTAKSIAEAKRVGADTKAAEIRNKYAERQADIEGLGSNSFPNWFWGMMDTIFSRMPLVHSAADLNLKAGR